MKKVILLCAVAAAASSSYADKAIYGGNVATLGVSTNDVQERILFDGKIGDTRTYTLSADTTIHSGGFARAGNATEGYAGVTMDFSDGDHTLTFAADSLMIYQSYQDIKFIGGVWDLNGKAFLPTGKPGGAGFGYNNRVTLSDGCVMTNVSALGTSGNGALYGSPDYAFKVTEASTLHLTGAAYVFYNCSAGADIGESTNMLFEISGGSYMRCQDFCLDGGNSSPELDRNNVFRVTGEGTRFVSAGSFMMGYGTRGNVFEVADKATASIYFPRLGQHANTSGTGFRVTGGASLSVIHTLVLGSTDEVERGGLFLHVLDGASVTTDSVQPLKLSSRNNEVLVSNGVVTVGTFLRIGDLEGATGNVVRISGPQSVFQTGQSFDGLFGRGSANAFIVDCGANITNTMLSFGYTQGETAGSNNMVKVAGNGVLTLTDKLLIGDSKRLDLERGNSLVVAAGGTLNVAKGINVYGTNNTIVVSNGTLNATYDTSSSLDIAGICFGRYGNEDTNATLVVQGDSPRILIPKTSLLFKGGAKLRFDLPRKGYKDDLPPLEIQQIMNYDMDFEFNGLTELQESLVRNKDIDLVKMSYRMWDGPSAFAAIDRINAKLAVTNPGCYLAKRGKYSDGNGETLYLHVKHTGQSGVLILVR